MNVSPRTTRIVYWISTLIVVLGVALPAALFSNTPAAIEGMRELGFPHYFVMELAVAKVLGAIALVLPMFPRRLKEWAYVGFAIDFISAVIANYIVHGVVVTLEPLVAFVVLAVSYVFYHEMIQA